MDPRCLSAKSPNAYTARGWERSRRAELVQNLRNPRLGNLVLAYLDTDDHDEEKRMLADIIVALAEATARAAAAADPRNFGPWPPR